MPKQNFNEKLTALLKTHPNFLDDTGELIPAAIRDHAWRLDHNLIKLLLTELVIDASVSPAFYRDCLTLDDIEKLQYEPPIYRKEESFAFCSDNEFLRFHRKFLSSLSLACNTVVQISLQLNFLNEDTLFNLSRGRIGNVVYHPQAISCSSTEVEEAHINKAKHLYKRLGNLDTRTLEKLQIPIDRWIKSKTFHAAWHLGKDKKQREALMKEFKAIYDWRSTVVHTGKLPKKTRNTPEKVEAFITKAQDLCRDSIMKILEDGDFPNWNDLILG